LPDSMQSLLWTNTFHSLLENSVSQSTQKCRKAALNKFSKFGKSNNVSIKWPISQQLLNGFVIWCAKSGNLNPETIKSYIFCLSSIQREKGLGPIQFSKTIPEILIKGWENKFNYVKRKRGVVTLNMLSEIKNKIFSLSCSKVQKFSLWAACSVAFLSCFRMMNS